MTYDLVLGDRATSSWSLRAWLLFEKFDLPRRTRWISLDDGQVPDLIPDMFPAKTVPVLRLPEGIVVWDSLAIAEELATRHPEAGLWPAMPGARAVARALASEMHSGFTALRSHCPMNVLTSYADVPVDAAVAADITRIDAIWTHARAVCAGPGPWLCGTYSIADVFFAPVAARIAGFGLAVSDDAQAYVEAHLNDPAFRRWRAMAVASGPALARYDQPYAKRPWPGPAPKKARAVDHGPSENTACPYSGDPVTDFLDLDGRVFGFCNPFCRDKTLADPEAWPAFMELVAQDPR